MNATVSRFASPVASQRHEPLIVRSSHVMQDLCAYAARVATSNAKVLITGESGVGKDLLAQYLHAHSARAYRPLVSVNCAAFSEALLESELFGHVKGSFTGAYRDKVGTLERAHRGTIFLDEVGDMSKRMQGLLLRFLDHGEIQPVGAHGPTTRVDVRVLTATNRNLTELVANGHFREDLLYRLRVIQIAVPPLRERREDIRPLVELAVARTGQSIAFTELALRALEDYCWPGNVRELQNVVEQMVWTASMEIIDLADLPPALRAESATRQLFTHDVRSQVADDLYCALVSRQRSWSDVRDLFRRREITRHDLRELIRRGLSTTRGNYRALVKLFGMEATEYRRLLALLAKHECSVDFREFRSDQPRCVGKCA